VLVSIGSAIVIDILYVLIFIARGAVGYLVIKGMKKLINNRNKDNREE